MRFLQFGLLRLVLGLRTRILEDIKGSNLTCNPAFSHAPSDALAVTHVLRLHLRQAMKQGGRACTGKARSASLTLSDGQEQQSGLCACILVPSAKSVPYKSLGPYAPILVTVECGARSHCIALVRMVPVVTVQ